MSLRWWLTLGFAPSYRHEPGSLAWVWAMNRCRLSIRDTAAAIGRGLLPPLALAADAISALIDAGAIPHHFPPSPPPVRSHRLYVHGSNGQLLRVVPLTTWRRGRAVSSDVVRVLS